MNVAIRIQKQNADFSQKSFGTESKANTLHPYRDTSLSYPSLSVTLDDFKESKRGMELMALYFELLVGVLAPPSSPIIFHICNPPVTFFGLTSVTISFHSQRYNLVTIDPVTIST